MPAKKPSVATLYSKVVAVIVDFQVAIAELGDGRWLNCIVDPADRLPGEVRSAAAEIRIPDRAPLRRKRVLHARAGEAVDPVAALHDGATLRRERARRKIQIEFEIVRAHARHEIDRRVARDPAPVPGSVYACCTGFA